MAVRARLRRAGAPRGAAFSHVTRWWGQEQRRETVHSVNCEPAGVLRLPELGAPSTCLRSTTVFSDCTRQQLLCVKC